MKKSMAEENGDRGIPVEEMDDFDDDFGDFEEASGVETDNATTNTIEHSTSDRVDRPESVQDTSKATAPVVERIGSQYVTTSVSPEDYERMVQDDLKMTGVAGNYDEADNVILPLHYTDLEGADMYGSLLSLEGQSTQLDSDGLKTSDAVRVSLVKHLIDDIRPDDANI